MKTLSFDEMKRVSGAGHFGDVRDANMGKSNKNTGSNNKGNTGYYNNLGQDVTNCNNGIIGGMIAGAPGGVLGLGAGLVGGALAGGCFLTGMEMAVVAVNPPEVIVVQEWAVPVNNRS